MSTLFLMLGSFLVGLWLPCLWEPKLNPKLQATFDDLEKKGLL